MIELWSPYPVGALPKPEMFDHKHDPENCPHVWEWHLWEQGYEWCKRCCSYKWEDIIAPTHEQVYAIKQTRRGAEL